MQEFSREDDILLSKSQLEKAWKEGEKYSIFVVEHVEDETQQQIWELRDPVSHFTKMQLDHGWKKFSEQRWSPAHGNNL